MHTYKSAVLFNQNQDSELRLCEILDRKPLQNEVKVKMVTTGLCGKQVNEITGKLGEDKYLPHFIGHEGFGQVIATGSGVQKFQLGDYVILHWRPAIGTTIEGMKCKSIDGIEIGGGPVTTFSEITFVAENRCTKITPEPRLFNIYPLLGCALPTAYGAIVKEVFVKKEDNVLIIGAGGLGMALLFWCNVLRIDSVCVADIHQGKKVQVEALGGKFLHVDELNKLDKKFSVIFETSGVTQNVVNAFELADKGARLSLIGQTRKGESVTFENFLKFYDDMSIISSQGGLFEPTEDMQALCDYLSENQSLASKLVSKIIPLSRINEGFQLMKDPTARRIIIDFRM